MTLAEVASLADVSEATVINLAQALGFGGYSAFRDTLLIEVNDRSQLVLEDVSPDDSLAVAAKKIAHADANAILDTLQNMDMDSLTRALTAIQNARRTNFLGVGISGCVASDAYQRFLRFGLEVRVFTEAHILVPAMSLTSSGDVVVGISHLGRSKEVVDGVQVAREAGAVTIAITHYPRSPLTKHCDIKLYTASRETILRGGACSSRIAQLAVIDMLFAGLVGADYDSLERAVRMTREAAARLRY